MTMLPIFLKLEGRRCLLVGAGNVALEKIASLLKTGLRLRVIAPHARPEIQQLARERKLEWLQRSFEPSDLDGNTLVIAATDAPEVNALVYRESVRRGILANSVDDIPNCDFFFASVVSRGNLQIAISTAGESPALAQRLRREIDEQLPADLGPWLEDLGALRREILAVHPRSEERKLLLHQLAKAECALLLVRRVSAEQNKDRLRGHRSGFHAPRLPQKVDGSRRKELAGRITDLPHRRPVCLYVRIKFKSC